LKERENGKQEGRLKQLLNDLKEERRDHYMSQCGEGAFGVLQDGLLKDIRNLIENLKKI
jgi:hypothetical protein